MIETNFKYPFIGKDYELNLIVLFESDGRGIVLEGVLLSSRYEDKNYEDDWNARAFQDITQEYLKTTKVKINSPEHLQWVKKILDTHGFEGCITDDNNPHHIAIEYDCSWGDWQELAWSTTNSINKEIFLPPPPSYTPEEYKSLDDTPEEEKEETLEDVPEESSHEEIPTEPSPLVNEVLINLIHREDFEISSLVGVTEDGGIILEMDETEYSFSTTEELIEFSQALDVLTKYKHQ